MDLLKSIIKGVGTLSVNGILITLSVFRFAFVYTFVNQRTLTLIQSFGFLIDSKSPSM